LGKRPQYDNLLAVPVPLNFTTTPPAFSDIQLTEGCRFAKSGALGYTTGRRLAQFGWLQLAGEEILVPSRPEALHKLGHFDLIVIAQPNQ
jgi:hypothetical protein